MLASKQPGYTRKSIARYNLGSLGQDRLSQVVMGNRFPRIYLVYFFLFSSYFVPVLHTSDFPETYMLLSCIILFCSR